MRTITLFLVVIIFASIQAAEETLAVTLGAASWNVGEKAPDRLMKGGAGHKLIFRDRLDTDIVFIAQQEGKYGSRNDHQLFDKFHNTVHDRLDANPRFDDYDASTHSLCNTFVSFGAYRCLFSDIYIKKTLTATLLQKGYTITMEDPVIIPHTSHNILNAEKSTVKRTIKISRNGRPDIKMCFLNSHFPPSKNTFVFFKSVQESDEVGINQCHYWMWSGDFNFRTADHTDEQVNNVYTTYFTHMTAAFKKSSLGIISVLDDSSLETAKDSHTANTVPMYKENVAHAPTSGCVNWNFLYQAFYMNNELNKSKTKLTNTRIPPFGCFPPTFSRSKECGAAVTTLQQFQAFGRDLPSEKYPFCFETAAGGCPGVDFTCYPGDRPPSWTDIIFSSDTVTLTRYGTYSGVTVSDHSPVFSISAASLRIVPVVVELENVLDLAEDVFNIE